jgi:hypothetical protein
MRDRHWLIGGKGKGASLLGKEEREKGKGASLLGKEEREKGKLL